MKKSLSKAWEAYHHTLDSLSALGESLPADTSLDIPPQVLANTWPEACAARNAEALDKELDAIVEEAINSRQCSACYHPAIAYTFSAIYSQPHNLCKDHLREMARTYPHAVIVFYPRSQRS